MQPEQASPSFSWLPGWWVLCWYDWLLDKNATAFLEKKSLRFASESQRAGVERRHRRHTVSFEIRKSCLQLPEVEFFKVLPWWQQPPTNELQKIITWVSVRLWFTHMCFMRHIWRGHCCTFCRTSDKKRRKVKRLPCLRWSGITATQMNAAYNVLKYILKRYTKVTKKNSASVPCSLVKSTSASYGAKSIQHDWTDKTKSGAVVESQTGEP